MKHILLSISLGAVVAQAALAQGYIVPNGITNEGFVQGAGSVFHVLQNPTSMDYTGFFLMPQDPDTFQIFYILDERVRVFFVTANQPVALQPILSGSYSEYLGPTDFADGIPFYLGLYTGYFPQDGVYENPLYGWAQLVNNGGVINLLDSALVYGADGIYVGTKNFFSVPEPSAASLLCLSLLGLRWARQAKKSLSRQ